MVTRFDVEVAGGQANFGWKFMFFFQLLSTIKVNIVAKIMQSAYLSVIFHVKHKKIPFLAVLTWIQILGKIRYDGQDGDHCWWRHRPPAVPSSIKYTSSCSEDQRLSTKGKIIITNLYLYTKSCHFYMVFLGIVCKIILKYSKKLLDWKILKHIKNSGEGFHPPSPSTTAGVWICLYVRGLT